MTLQSIWYSSFICRVHNDRKYGYQYLLFVNVYNYINILTFIHWHLGISMWQCINSLILTYILSHYNFIIFPFFTSQAYTLIYMFIYLTNVSHLSLWFHFLHKNKYGPIYTVIVCIYKELVHGDFMPDFHKFYQNEKLCFFHIYHIISSVYVFKCCISSIKPNISAPDL